ncbi:MAG: PepSY domain-containing protein [Pseudomonadota bacterium]
MRFWIVLLAASLAVPGAVADSDHDRARRAVEEGRILPLKEILARAQRVNAGQVIEAELEEKGGTLVYEIKILSGDGRLMKLFYDARTGELLKARGRHGTR